MTEAEIAVKKTIDYAKKHDCKLSRKELLRRLISKEKLSKSDLNKALKKYKSLLGRDDFSPSFNEKLDKAHEYSKSFAKIFPSILMIGVTGSVASRYPKTKDDIDLFVVTRSGSLWIVRLILRFWVWINRIPHRKYNQKQKKDELCFNLWVENDSLYFPAEKQNLRSAIDGRLMIPVLNKEGVYEKFMIENDWIFEYVSREQNRRIIVSNKMVSKSPLLIRWLNYGAYWPQYLLMKKKMKKERVGIKFAFFHKN